MTPKTWRAAALAAALSSAAAPALAHHAFATFDAGKSVTLDGAVKEFQWTNPHVWIQLVVKDSTGREVEWSIEGASVSVLSRRGWTRRSIKPGDKAVVVVHPSKEGTADGQLVSATVNGAPLGTHD
jgi:Family of unknown function (DUF6152)